jgi:beta-galactosidase GanA
MLAYARGFGVHVSTRSKRIWFGCGALALLGCVLPMFAQAREPLLPGTAWYPEHWPEQRWETDPALMQKAHLHVVRAAEFAWSTLEPSEGKYEFGWLDRAIALAATHDIKVGGLKGTATIWAEALEPQAAGVTVLLRYGRSAAGEKGWLDDLPAAVSRRVGKGSMTYVGPTLDAGLMREFTRGVLREAGVVPAVKDLAAGVELNERSAAGRPTVWIFINHGEQAQQVPLPAGAKDVLHSDEAVGESMALRPHDVAVLEMR